MSHKGNNILGDKKYRKKFKKLKNIDQNLEKHIYNLNRQFLHAKMLGFIHPKSGKKLRFSSILPNELMIIIKTLRNIDK
jgi:23S rRNA pseudouridine1911/1915/1917 synthase